MKANTLSSDAALEFATSFAVMEPKRLISAPALAALLITATTPVARLQVVAADAPTNKSLHSLARPWIFVPHPVSLEGSLAGFRTTTNSRGHPSVVGMSFRLNCAAAASPDNDACRAASLYPVDVEKGAGEIGTVTSAGTTTAWSCRIADDTSYGASLSALCVNTLASAGSSTTVSTSMDGCAVQARTVLANITAGWDKLMGLPDTVKNGDNIDTASASEWSSYMSDYMSSLHCSPLRLGVSSTATPPAPSPAAGGGSTPTTGLRATAGRPTPTAKSPNGGAQRIGARTGFGGMISALLVWLLVIIS